MSPLVYDASALLAVIFDERGADAVIQHLGRPGGEISAVNWSEVGAKLVQRGLAQSHIAPELAAFALEVVPFDEAQAHIAAGLRLATRPLRLSLGGRCCLALGRLRGARIVTADAAWTQVPDFDIVSVRDS